VLLKIWNGDARDIEMLFNPFSAPESNSGAGTTLW